MDTQEELLINDYVEKFCKENLYGAIYYCKQWDGTNGINFGGKGPEDIVLETLELILQGKRKVYLESYENFKNSVYYHLKNTLLTKFGCRKKKVEEESPHYININEFKAISYCDDEYYEEYEEQGDKELVESIEIKELIEKLFSLFDQDKEVEELLVLEGYLSGKKREEIAEDLGISVKDVTNIKKRIIRRVLKLLKIEGMI
ncbi:MAG: hypothetical protein N2249_01930 [Melioribacter sp.]|nr:hypothetical protein [Melioribacter sp.]